jgi:4-amino-4-deoxy-L-arabinose transferase-like glycosyltransferase
VERRVWRKFAAALALVTIGGLGLRVAYTVAATQRPDAYVYDSAFYRGEARALAEGHGFVQPGFVGLTQANTKQPAADHPPLFSVVLAPVSWLSGDDDLALRLFNCLLGAIGVALIGLLGREFAGDATGLIAAAGAALYPNLWVNDGVVMSESLAVVIVSASVLLALRVIRRPTVGGAVALALFSGLGALARSELALLFPLLCVPAIVAGCVKSGRRPFGLLVVSLLVVTATVGPWVGYNLSRFRRPVLISTNFDLNLLGSSCPSVMRGPSIGSLGFCTFLQAPTGADQSVIAYKQQKQAFKYIGDNLGRYPVVVLARLGRTWSLFRPHDALDVGLAEGRPHWVTWLGLVCYYPLLALAVAGAWLRRRRRQPLWPLLVPPAIVTVSMLVSYGQVRYRVVAEPVLVVLAAQFVVARRSRSIPRDQTSAAAVS